MTRYGLREREEYGLVSPQTRDPMSQYCGYWATWSIEVLWPSSTGYHEGLSWETRATYISRKNRLNGMPRKRR